MIASSSFKHWEKHLKELQTVGSTSYTQHVWQCKSLLKILVSKSQFWKVGKLLHFYVRMFFPRLYFHLTGNMLLPFSVMGTEIACTGMNNNWDLLHVTLAIFILHIQGVHIVYPCDHVCAYWYDVTQGSQDISRVHISVIVDTSYTPWGYIG